MLIIGAKGFAIEVLEVLNQLDQLNDVAFYDDVNQLTQKPKYDKFQILSSLAAAERYFEETSRKFTLGLGNPSLRSFLAEKFRKIGGELSSTISPLAQIGHFENAIGTGCNIMTNVIITNEVHIGQGCLINLNATIGHNAIIDEFVEVCPGVNISGNTSIGAKSFLGTNSTILPGIQIGKNVVIGANALVTKDIPDNVVAVGAPAKVIKELKS